ncbi:MAG: flagellar export protein FliJ [Dehalococcoidia bacterium]|nr:MAG: flagellar export protein FliJ [Dehalococcoidia bacterium]
MAEPFRLRSLLDYRRQLEDEQMRALAEVTAEEQRVRDAIAALDRHREDQTAALAALMTSGTFDAGGYTQRASYLEAIGIELDQQVAALEAAAARVSEQRAALVEALKDRRVLERLRDRQAAEAAIEDGRQEARVVDDMTTSRHQRTQ